MSLEENRNCGCNNTSNYSTSPVSNMMSASNMMSNGDGCGCGNDETVLAKNVYGDCGCEPTRVVNCEARREMMQEIRCLEFAINELALYLDTHPDDQKALCLHRKYAKEAKELKDKYQKVFGPLTINFPCNKWRWLEEPWPWERGNF